MITIDKKHNGYLLVSKGKQGAIVRYDERDNQVSAPAPARVGGKYISRGLSDAAIDYVATWLPRKTALKRWNENYSPEAEARRGREMAEDNRIFESRHGAIFS